MKHTKKLFALVLCIVLALSLAVPAFAANDGSITITNATKDVKYSIYKVFDLTYSGDAVAYTYTKTGNSDELFTALTGTGSPFTLTATSIANVYNVSTSAEAPAIAEWLKTNADKLTESGSQVASGATVEFKSLAYGYYYVTSTMGTAVTINSAKPHVDVTDKNKAPELKKEVKEGNDFGETNSADIGDKVEYQVEIKAQAGAANYILHDKMTAGLTFNNDVSVKADAKTLTEGTDYTVKTTELGHDCTFEVHFKQDYLDTITTETTIVVSYSATLNENAVIYEGSNDNTAKLQYGHAVDTNNDGTTDTTPETPGDTTKTYTYEFDLVKTDKDNKLLSGAEFELYASDKTTKINLIKADPNNYRVAKTNETNTVTTIAVADGDVTIKGLDNGTYYLKETKAPNGYNPLLDMQEVKINSANLNATVNNNIYSEGGVQVVNQSGTVLPETGGMGTTIFYAVGGIMVVAAVVLLVTKKRMGAEG